MKEPFELDFEQSIIANSTERFEVQQRLGAGSNAVTYLVTASTGSFKGVPFALKLFRNLSKPERRDSFLTEIAYLKDCNHPSIMRIYDSGIHADRYPFVVAEYLPRTLRSMIRGDSATLTERISFVAQVLSALSYLANESPPVAHRDIKPENIFVKGRSCVLGDFGLMKRIASNNEQEDREQFKESLGAGMPRRYRTPDLVNYLNGRVDLTAKTDVFQFGLVAAELFTGRNPQRRSRRFSDPVRLEPLEKISSAMGSVIKDVVLSMLEFDVDTRPDAVSMLDQWQHIFKDAASQSRALEGKVFF